MHDISTSEYFNSRIQKQKYFRCNEMYHAMRIGTKYAERTKADAVTVDKN